MVDKVETIWDYLASQHYKVTPRSEKHTVHLVLESEKLNKAQKARMDDYGIAMEKLDGVFSLVTIINTSLGLEVRHWGRTGKALSGCEALDKRMAAATVGKTNTGVVLLSEITSELPLAKLSGYLNPNRGRAKGIPEGLQDNVFDSLSIGEFIEGRSSVGFNTRLTYAEHLLEGSDVSVVGHAYVTFDAAKGAAEEIWEHDGEGVIFAQAEGTWTAGKRDETKIKIKEKLSYDVTVVGMCSGKEGSKYEHTLGKLVVQFRAFGDPKGEPLLVPISGMTDNQRDAWWSQPECIIGSIVKMDAKSFTENGNLREPRFKEIRHDKAQADFPCEVLEETTEFTKGKAYHIIHALEITQ